MIDLNKKPQVTTDQLLDEFKRLDDFICRSEYYSQSGEATEIDDMFRYINNELDYKVGYERDIINTYGDMSEKEMLTRMCDCYELLVKERMFELRQQIQTLD